MTFTIHHYNPPILRYFEPLEQGKNWWEPTTLLSFRVHESKRTQGEATVTGCIIFYGWHLFLLLFSQFRRPHGSYLRTVVLCLVIRKTVTHKVVLVVVRTRSPIDWHYYPAYKPARNPLRHRTRVYRNGLSQPSPALAHECFWKSGSLLRFSQFGSVYWPLGEFSRLPLFDSCILHSIIGLSIGVS